MGAAIGVHSFAGPYWETVRYSAAYWDKLEGSKTFQEGSWISVVPILHHIVIPALRSKTVSGVDAFEAERDLLFVRRAQKRNSRSPREKRAGMTVFGRGIYGEPDKVVLPVASS